MDTPVFIGIMPLTSSKNAEFIHNEVPGIKLPENVRQAMAAAGNDPNKHEEKVCRLLGNS